MSTWLIDIGNTKIAFALLDQGELTTRYTIPTIELDTVSLDFIRDNGDALIASVVPDATVKLQGLLERRGITSKVISSDATPMQNEYEEIEKLGSDRILAAFAAYEIYGKAQGKNIIVVSLGTATTFECVTKAGVYLGGAITLGIGSIIEAIKERTAQLPQVPLDVPKSAIGRTTMSALQSGILNTQLLGIREFKHKLAAEAFPEGKPLVIATGGLAPFVRTHLPEVFDEVDLDLVLKGLALMAARVERRR
jgi:type III pantothenate kinase